MTDLHEAPDLAVAMARPVTDAATPGSAHDDVRLARIHLRLGMLSIARAELENGSLVSLPLGPRKLRRRWGVAHLKGRRLALAEETFVGLCASVSEALGLKSPGVAA